MPNEQDRERGFLVAYNTALLIDAENVQTAALGDILEAVKQTGNIGQVAVRRAYAHWQNQSNRTKDQLFELMVDPIEAGCGKHAADVRLAGDAMELVKYLPSIDVYVLVSGDGGLVPLTKQLRAFGKVVVVCGREETTRRTLKEACNAFVPIPGPSKSKSDENQHASASQDGLPDDRVERKIPVDGSEQRSNVRRIVDLLHDKAEYALKMRQGGLPIASVAGFLRKQIKDLDTSKKCWLRKLLLSACQDTEVCLAKALSSGELRLFNRDSVPQGYETVNACLRGH